jgi:hypothetical protein
MHSFWLGHQPSPFNAPPTTGGLFTVHFASSFLFFISSFFSCWDRNEARRTHTQKEEKEEEGLEKKKGRMSTPSGGNRMVLDSYALML